MKKVLSFFLMILCLPALAQQLAGKVNYGEKIVAIGIDTSTVSNDQIKSIVVKQIQEKKRVFSAPVKLYELSFTFKESLFEPVPLMSNEGNLLLERFQSKGRYYMNRERKKLHQLEVFGGTYVVEEEYLFPQWKITTSERSIAGYMCREAYADIEVRPGNVLRVTAWFTPRIPISFGPKGYGGLPGLILGLEEKGHYYYAMEVVLKKDNGSPITPPLKGKLISKEQYQQMVKDAINKMRGGKTIN